MPNVAVNTTIQIMPDNADGRSYLAQQEAHVRQEQAALSPTNMAAMAAMKTATYAQGTSDAQSLSTLVGRLGSQVENTTTNGDGNWACQGVTFQTPYLLWVSMAITTTKSVTPIPLASALGTLATQRSHTTQIFYTTQITATDISNWFSQRYRQRNSVGNANWFEVPFSRWTQIAQITQPV